MENVAETGTTEHQGGKDRKDDEERRGERETRAVSARADLQDHLDRTQRPSSWCTDHPDLLATQASSDHPDLRDTLERQESQASLDPVENAAPRATPAPREMAARMEPMDRKERLAASGQSEPPGCRELLDPPDREVPRDLRARTAALAPRDTREMLVATARTGTQV